MPEEKHSVFKKVIVWQLLTLVFASLFLGVLFGKVSFVGPGIGSEEAGNRVVNYINKNLIESGSCSLVSVQESGGLYKVTTLYQGKQIPVYITKDGNFLFISQPLDLNQLSNATQTQTEVPKTSKPTVDLYVMSFCPYGIQAESLMKPVFDILGDKADFKIRFIASVGGNTIDSIQSLHGSTEAKEDLRQICIMKYYDSKTYWKYLEKFNTDCPSVRSDETALENCWKTAATNAGIDASKIQICSSGSEGLDLLKADEKLVNQYGISGSPTLLINNVLYNGDRSSDSFKQAICNGFTTPPAECSQTITSSSGTVASGGCG